MIIKLNISNKVNNLNDKEGKYFKIKNIKEKDSKIKHDIFNIEQKYKIENKNNKDTINLNNLTLDLSNEDLSNINYNLRSNISSFKLNDDKIYQKELLSFKIDGPIESSINIDEESKSYIRDIIELCKDGKKDLEKKNILIYSKLFNNKKEYYIENNNNNNINKLKTEDLIEISRRRKEKFNIKRKNILFNNNSIKYFELQTEKNRYIDTENNIDTQNYYLAKNKTNRININDEYYSNILKKNNNKYINNNINDNNKNENFKDIKNHLFYLYKNNAKKVSNFNNNKIKKNKSLNLVNKNKTQSFNKSKENINRIKKNKTIVFNKGLFINNNEKRKNTNYNSNNDNSKINNKEKNNILIKKINNFKVKFNIKNNPLKSDENNKCNYINTSPSNYDIKEPKESNIFYKNKSNIKFYNKYNIKNHQKNNKNIIINKPKNCLSIENKSKIPNLIIEDNKYNNKKKDNLHMFKKICNTSKVFDKNKEIYKSSININNDIISKKFLEKNNKNKRDNILNIKQLKLKANESLRKKINNNKNNSNKNNLQSFLISENKKNNIKDLYIKNKTLNSIYHKKEEERKEKDYSLLSTIEKIVNKKKYFNIDNKDKNRKEYKINYDKYLTNRYLVYNEKMTNLFKL